MTNFTNKVLYIGVTNNLQRRVLEHKQRLIIGFSQKYNTTKLVYAEQFRNVYEAITAEKKIKGWLRKKKIALIESINPLWQEIDPSFHSG